MNQLVTPLKGLAADGASVELLKLGSVCFRADHPEEPGLGIVLENRGSDFFVRPNRTGVPLIGSRSRRFKRIEPALVFWSHQVSYYRLGERISRL